MAWLALIIAVLALLLCWVPPLAIPLAVVAITLSLVTIGRGRAHRLNGGSEALPIIGLVIASCALIPSVVIAVLITLAVSLMDGSHSPPPPAPPADFTTM